MIFVSNSTPLIALSRIKKFDLLREYFGEIHIPEEVFDEVVTRGGDLSGAEEVPTAESLGLKITGTLGILLLAREDGKLDLKIALNYLMAAGFRLSEKEYKRILSLSRG